MTFSALYVLPALAVFILIEGFLTPGRGKHPYRSRKSMKWGRARKLFMRALVIALFMATALTIAWPLPPISDLMQGVMLTVAFMIPICVYIIINNLWSHDPDKQDADATPNDLGDTPDLRPASAPTLTPLEQILAPEREAEPAYRLPETQTATSLHRQSSEQESALDQTLSVGEQLETLDELVDFHDIGDEPYQAQVFGPYDPDAAPAYNPLEKAIAVARDAILEEPGLQDYSTENLPARNRVELSEMVVRLRNDKMKLQKLVIAQKAVIDSEKQAHERTRMVVKDAISVMRHARHGQRIAEKIARRERSERQRLEKDYVKVRRALDNALSTVKSKVEQPEAQKA